MDGTWTLSELVAEAAARLEALPSPKNGQVRAVPDERTVRYYAALGLLDRPAAMRGRTALYAARHLAQVVAIKRMQSADKSLAEIQALWPSLDDATLARMSGVALPAAKARGTRKDFWKRDQIQAEPIARGPMMRPAPAPTYSEADAVELRIEIAPGAFMTLAVPDGISIHPADVRALRAAAAPLVTELANRGLIARAPGTLEE